MQLFLDNIFKIGTNGIDLKTLKAQEPNLNEFMNNIMEKDFDFCILPNVKAQVLAVKTLAEKFKGKFENIAILGIGGSALGAKCLLDALKGPYWNLSNSPKLIVLDNLDLIYEFEQNFDLDKTLFIVISKSGETPETMAQYYYFRNKVSKEHFIFITDGEKGTLRDIGNKDKIHMLTIPENIGGRFSVLTAVGLFPAALLGIDIEEILSGAADMVKNYKTSNFEINVPFLFATVQYLLEWQNGVNITVMMPYSSRLIGFADWYRQLLAESIGKDGKGLTPVKALGVTDQHSQIQLYNEGPNDKLIVFIEVEETDETILPNVTDSNLRYLSQISFSKLMNTEMQATEQTLTQYKKPNIKIKIPKVDERSIGKLIMMMECSIAFLGEYYRINAFDQPGVELGKKLTKEMLSKSK
ncbi:glucose-6-phosphate isomerase [Patescibacteria group bacterium]|nr:glucose-6-phosphate isomerase [Patescibacteria group bacterium]